MRRTAHLEQPEVVCQIQDLATFSGPYFTYQDLSFGSLLRFRALGFELVQFPALSDRMLASRDVRQRHIYHHAAGILAMSHWLRDQLVQDGIPPEKIHVVHPGTNVRSAGVGHGPSRTDLAQVKRAPYQGDRAPRLLFVGRDFRRKAGDLVVEAFTRLRQESYPLATLTVVGPREWPLPAPPPEGVAYLGELSGAEVRQLFGAADLFVMPSRFEAFGIVFAEALAAGVPCIARRSFAMPEIVQDGRNGALINSESPSDLVDVMTTVLEDRELHERVWQERENTAGYWSWARAADELVRIFEDVVRG